MTEEIELPLIEWMEAQKYIRCDREYERIGELNNRQKEYVERKRGEIGKCL